MSEAEALTASCANCGTSLHGHFCPSCGQKQRAGLPSISDMFHEILGALLSYDGKLWRSLRLLIFRPGQLTVEYVEGRRVRYLGPFQLFIWLQAIAFASHRTFFSSEVGVNDRKSLTLLIFGLLASILVWVFNHRRLQNYTHALLAATHVWAFLMFWLLVEYSLSIPITSLLVRSGFLRGEIPLGQFVTWSTILVLVVYLFLSLQRALNLKALHALLQTAAISIFLLSLMLTFPNDL